MVGSSLHGAFRRPFDLLVSCACNPPPPPPPPYSCWGRLVFGMIFSSLTRYGASFLDKAIDERTEKISGKQADASATPARRVGGTDPGAGLSKAPATAKVNAGAKKRSGADNAGVAGNTVPPNQRQAGPGVASGNDGNGTRSPPSAGAGVAGSSSGAGVGAGAGASFSPVGSERSERNVFAMMDDQVYGPC